MTKNYNLRKMIKDLIHSYNDWELDKLTYQYPLELVFAIREVFENIEVGITLGEDDYGLYVCDFFAVTPDNLALNTSGWLRDYHIKYMSDDEVKSVVVIKGCKTVKDYINSLISYGCDYDIKLNIVQDIKSRIYEVTK